ncbi:MAG: DUF58 domain-containing protein [Clostridia bacterium]|nr:DUF58 domain-containing protein [Clostridia bacterium]
MRNKFVINEEFISQLETLQSIIKNNVAGMFGGNRKSKVFGSSCEFADYRDYAPGDDITKIDWNAYSRFDQLYMKLYLDERQMHTRIYIDASRSMEYGDGKKAEQAIKIAAAIAYISLGEMDKVSIYTIRNSAVESVISGMVGKDSYISSIGKLNEIEFDGDSNISDALLPESVGYGDGMSVIISDYLTDNDYEAAIDHLVNKKRDVFCVQVLSMSETNPQFKGKNHLFDSEDGSKFYRKNIDRDIINAYKRALEYVVDRMRGYCDARGANYLFASAEDSVFDIFFGKLTDMGVLK